jgi:predicted MFS family arabinose efflux permease
VSAALVRTPSVARHAHAGVSAILFLCLFAAQGGLIALSPVLVEAASDLGVSTATAGQLRTISGLAAGVTALLLASVARRVGLRQLLLGGAVLLAAGSLASATAPSFAVLALAQVLVGVAVAVLVTAGTAAAAEWASPENRTRVLSWALIGNPAAWIVGMPAIGLLGEASWRLGWLAFPLVAALAAAVAVARGGPATPASTVAGGGILSALGDRAVRRWALGEILANSAWIGLLVYAGALFVESYGTSTALTGVLLALAAASFIGGNLAFRRSASGELRPLLVGLALGMAVLVALFGTVRPGVAVSTFLFAAAAFLGGARTLLGNAYGLQAAPEQRVAVMATRAAANQFGYFVGAAVAGAAIAAFGYSGLGIVLGLLFVAAALSLADVRRAGIRLSLLRRTRQGEPEAGLS